MTPQDVKLMSGKCAAVLRHKAISNSDLRSPKGGADCGSPTSQEQRYRG